MSYLGRSPRLCRLALQAIVAAALVWPAHASPERLHRYTVRIDPELTEISVRACFDGSPPSSLVAESLDAPLALIEARVESSRKAVAPSGALPLKDLGDDGCLLYRVNVSRPIKLHDRTGDKIRRVGRDLLASAGLWLWRPETIAPDEDVELEFDLPDGVTVSAPWSPVAPSPRPTVRLGRTPYDWPATVAFGRFRERELRVAGARLRVAVLDGSPAPDLEQVHGWLADAAQMVAGVSGRFPVEQAQVLVVPDARGNEPTPSAYVVRGGNPAVHFLINQRRPPEEFYADWTATHELAHLLVPFVDHNDAWLPEGVATYYQTVLRARAGRLSEREAWSSLHAGFRRGRNAAPGLTLAQATENMSRGATFMRVYWEGAAMILLADVRLRQLTAGKQSMDTALAALQDCCLDPERSWTAKELFARLDEITSAQVFSELYEAHVASRDFPDLTGIYRQLGIQPAADGVELAPEAPHRRLREAIMTHAALLVGGFPAQEAR
jgi:hypothetical protein